MNDDDELPYMTSRDDLLSSHVEFIGPFQRTYAVLNGMKVPHLTIGDSQGDEVFLIADDRLAISVPKSHVERVIAFIGDIVAIERGYGCFPRTPDEQRPLKAPPFGPIMHAVESTGKED